MMERWRIHGEKCEKLEDRTVGADGVEYLHVPIRYEVKEIEKSIKRELRLAALEDLRTAITQTYGNGMQYGVNMSRAYTAFLKEVALEDVRRVVEENKDVIIEKTVAELVKRIPMMKAFRERFEECADGE